MVFRLPFVTQCHLWLKPKVSLYEQLTEGGRGECAFDLFSAKEAGIWGRAILKQLPKNRL
jgi:hypothetical protein